ncbi:hypothetical protein [Vibrio furnissii]|uniref:hypothetical protein n=1 Tax=Vibrio TaxID=662 RepID=UPI0015598770|nr:hypothetical protein [Vibrio furnissii]MCG6227674.1 hypothetical protein [Vibrio furnissii]WJG24473.1 hypothetical protein QSU95_18540 [Vibrio furnissii]WJG28063.1 hypothetical protein QSU96_21175 [Vibrio furnissii]
MLKTITHIMTIITIIFSNLTYGGEFIYVPMITGVGNYDYLMCQHWSLPVTVTGIPYPKSVVESWAKPAPDGDGNIAGLTHVNYDGPGYWNVSGGPAETYVSIKKTDSLISAIELLSKHYGIENGGSTTLTVQHHGGCPPNNEKECLGIFYFIGWMMNTNYSSSEPVKKNVVPSGCYNVPPTTHRCLWKNNNLTIDVGTWSVPHTSGTSGERDLQIECTTNTDIKISWENPSTLLDGRISITINDKESNKIHSVNSGINVIKMKYNYQFPTQPGDDYATTFLLIDYI